MHRIAYPLVALLVSWALGASAEIYRWTDESGTIHFTENIEEVPLAHRERARPATSAGARDRIQRIAPTASAPAAMSSEMARAGAPSATDKRVYRIRVAPGMGGMRVNVRLDDRVVAPFLIDTGASDVVIPQAVAQRLGIEVGPDTMKARYGTANGVIESPVVLLDSVELQGARANDVRASISASMPIGLLGLSFFNRFTYRIDATAGIVTLVPNEAGGSGEAGRSVRGGRTETQWRNEFRALRQRIAMVDHYYDDLDPLRQNNDRLAARAREQFERELEFLDKQADRARVPDSWRY
jgi:clan AA aspartic protease (TIGR02281 family)